VIEPASAFACVLTGAIDVSNSHAFPPFELYALSHAFTVRGKRWLVVVLVATGISPLRCRSTSLRFRILYQIAAMWLL
jgi:hypothetical protein